MNSSKLDKIIIFFGVTTLLVALISVYYPFLSLVYIMGVLGISLVIIVLKKNKYGFAHIMAGYIVGIEVFLRMVKVGIPWEFGKYAVIMLLTLGILVEKRKSNIPKYFLFYPLLFLPSVILTFSVIDFERARQLIFSNLGGQLVLFIAVTYFYKRKFTEKDFQILSKVIIIGVSAMALFTYIKTPDFGAISYSSNSNAAASGGFSGNQVSTSYGLGMLFLGLNLYRDKILFFYRAIDISLFFTFLLLGFLTFSRGGVIGAFLSLLIAIIIYKFFTLKEKQTKKIKIKLGQFITLIAVVSFAFIVINQLTGNMLQQRYLNTNKYGEFRQDKDLTTNRGKIASADIKLFEDNLFTGVGAGMGFSERKRYLGFETASHTEFSRILAEHGILGVFIIFIMFTIPITRYMRIFKSPESALILVTMLSYAFITMTHSAMRLALPGFLYGLGMIFLIKGHFNNE